LGDRVFQTGFSDGTLEAVDMSSVPFRSRAKIWRLPAPLIVVTVFC
jgi:hypothetical protein